jgi:ribonuclease Z
VLDVCLLGHGGMMPLPDRPLSAVAFRVGSETILFDCGEGTQVNWRKSQFNYRHLGTLLLSHLHADHIAGLPGVLFQIAYSGRTEPVTIFGPERTAEIVQHLITIVGRLPYELRVAEITGGQEFDLTEDIRISTLQLVHKIPCLGYRIDIPRAPRFDPERAEALGVPMDEWKHLQRGEPVGDVKPEDVLGPPREGITMSLITDTSWFDGIAPFVEGSELLICEAMFGTDDEEQRALERGHMTFRQAATIARDSNSRELWMTHFSPMVEVPEDHLENATAVFSLAQIGYPGLKTTLAFPED